MRAHAATSEQAVAARDGHICADALAEQIKRLAAENERLEMEALRWHGEAAKQERISEMYAKASIDAQEISRMDREDREAAESNLARLNATTDALTRTVVALGRERDSLIRERDAWKARAEAAEPFVKMSTGRA